MLTEARVDADQIRDLVFGLGLNVNSPAADWPADWRGRRSPFPSWPARRSTSTG